MILFSASSIRSRIFGRKACQRGSAVSLARRASGHPGSKGPDVDDLVDRTDLGKIIANEVTEVLLLDGDTLITHHLQVTGNGAIFQR